MSYYFFFRERSRKLSKGLNLLRAGKIVEGKQLIGESVDVSHDLVVNLMKECRKMNIDCIVAPYEADAQLAYFSINKIVSCIVTEDSDLLAYGCERVNVVILITRISIDYLIFL